MSKEGQNNRGPFDEVASLRVWRSPYGLDGRSELFVDVTFEEGHIGGEDDSPIRFKLGLRRAEVRIRMDAAGVLKVIDSSVARPPVPRGNKTIAIEKEGHVSGGADLKLGAHGVNATLDVGAKGGISAEEAVKFVEEIGRISTSYRATQEGYTFIVEPNGGPILKQAPWEPVKPRLTFRDPAYPRKRGEPPEPVVEILCRIEDLEIDMSSVQFKKKPEGFFASLSQPKRVAVLQYIRQQLTRHGLDFGSSLDPYAKLTIADALATEEPAYEADVP